MTLTMEKVPDEVLEMSFHKLLEQFFYNQRVTVSAKRDQEARFGEDACTHSLFFNCDLIFRFGPLKVHLKYEPLDVYSLDMFHFGLQKGIVTVDENARRVN